MLVTQQVSAWEYSRTLVPPAGNATVPMSTLLGQDLPFKTPAREVERQLPQGCGRFLWAAAPTRLGGLRGVSRGAQSPSGSPSWARFLQAHPLPGCGSASFT